MLSLRLLLIMALSLLSTPLPAQPARPRPTAAAGLTGTYYAGQNFDRKVFTRVDPAINFTWRNASPGPGLETTHYSIRWVGRLLAPVTGRYRFSVEVDDGIRVWVGGRPLISAWGLHDNDPFEGSIDLLANRYYDLRIDYFNAIFEGEIKLYWVIPSASGQAASTPRELIQPQYLGREPVRLVAAPPAVAPPNPQPVSAKPVMVKPVSRPAAPALPTPAQRVARTQPVPAPQRATAHPAPDTLSAPSGPVFESLTAGETVALPHVFFEQSDYRLLPAACAELDKLVRTMQQQPTLRIEIAGHTDDQGDPRLNLTLSENRAKVVVNYLARHGVAENRLTPKGYGGSRPLTDNVNEAARAQNRRVECIVR